MFVKILFFLLHYSKGLRNLDSITINGISASSDETSYINFLINNNIVSIISSSIETDSIKNKIFYYKDSSNSYFLLNDKENNLKNIYKLSTSDDIIVWSKEILNPEKPLNPIFYYLFSKDGEFLTSTNEFTDPITINQNLNSNILTSDFFKNVKQLYEKKSIDILDINSKFYSDYCYRDNIFTKDYIRKDKIEEIYYNICENVIISIFINENKNQKCVYNSIDYSNNIIQCQCQINNKINYPKFYERNNFFDIVNRLINLKVIKCNNMFKGPYVKKNAGFYFILIFIVFNICLLYLFIIFDYPKFKKDMKSIEKVAKFNQNIYDLFNLSFERFWEQKELNNEDIININNIRNGLKDNIDEDLKELNQNVKEVVKENVKENLERNIKEKINHKKRELIQNFIGISVENKYEESKQQNLILNDKGKEKIKDLFQQYIEQKISSLKEMTINMSKRLIKVIVSNILLYLCLLLFCNSLLFGENIIHINHKNNSLKFSQIFLIGNFAVGIANILILPIKKIFLKTNSIEYIIKEIIKKKSLEEIFFNHIKNTVSKVLIYYIISFLLLGFIFYYETVFCGLYHHSVKSMFYCYITGIISTIVYYIIIAVIIYFKNKKSKEEGVNPVISILNILISLA